MRRFIFISGALIIIAVTATVFVWYLIQDSYREAQKATTETFDDSQRVQELDASE